MREKERCLNNYTTHRVISAGAQIQAPQRIQNDETDSLTEAIRCSAGVLFLTCTQRSF